MWWQILWWKHNSSWWLLQTSQCNSVMFSSHDCAQTLWQNMWWMIPWQSHYTIFKNTAINAVQKNCVVNNARLGMFLSILGHWKELCLSEAWCGSFCVCQTCQWSAAIDITVVSLATELSTKHMPVMDFAHPSRWLDVIHKIPQADEENANVCETSAEVKVEQPDLHPRCPLCFFCFLSLCG